MATPLGLVLGIVLGFVGSTIWPILSANSTWRAEIGSVGGAAVWARWLDPFHTLSSVVSPIVGATIGLAQWFVLRGRVPRAGWYILASVLGWGLVLPITGEVFDSLLEFITVGAVPSGVTGLVLWWLAASLPHRALEASA